MRQVSFSKLTRFDRQRSSQAGLSVSNALAGQKKCSYLASGTSAAVRDHKIIAVKLSNTTTLRP